MYTREDVLDFVRQEDVHFIRLTFFDLFGRQKNLSILPKRLAQAFEKGVAIDSALVAGFENEYCDDLILHPDPSTMTILPWRSGNGNVIFMICDLSYPDGKPFPLDTRYLLKRTIQNMYSMNLDPMVAGKLQFYLETRSESGLVVPYDQGGYLDVSPLDQAENIRRDICLTLDEMGILPYKSFHQRGHGQNEIDFHFSPVLRGADEASMVKWVIRTLAQSNGVIADFRSLPFDKEPSSAMQIQFKFFIENKKIFENFLAGVLNHACELFFLLNPYEDSYKRFQDPYVSASVSYSSRRRKSLIRIPSLNSSILEIRNADARCNPYLAYFVILEAGMDGVRRNLPLPEEESILQELPESLHKAREISRRSQWLKSILPEHMYKSLMDHEYEQD